MDDLQEQMSQDKQNFGKFVFVSSWTDDEMESIPMWRMYTPKQRGVRIKLPTNPFVEYQATVQEVERTFGIPVVGDKNTYAERNGITIVDTYIDRALSAKTDNRPSFQKMIKDVSKQLFKYIIVWKLDRFARNRFDSAYYKHLLKKNGVRVLSARETIAEGSEGILLESVLEGYAEYFSADLSEKVLRGMTENALKCMNNGSGTPLGYYVDDEQHLQIDEKKVPYVREIFQRFADGEMIKTIIADMNARVVGITVRVKKSRGDKKPSEAYYEYTALKAERDMTSRYSVKPKTPPRAKPTNGSGKGGK